MIIFPHLLIGAAIGLRIHNLLAIFILGLFSHFLVDKIPHWDYAKQSIDEMDKKTFSVFLLKVSVDLAIGAALLSFLLWQQSAWIYALFGAFVSALPDLPILLRRFFPNIRWLASYQKIHDLNHFQHRPDKKIILSLASEMLIAAAAILFLKL